MSNYFYNFTYKNDKLYNFMSNYFYNFTQMINYIIL